MALIEKINAIADKIREVTGSTKKMSLDEIASEIGCLEVPPETYVLVDDDGNEFAASFVDEPVRLNATENDIREGYTAATDKGIITGRKVIPAYHTNQGVRVIPSGSEIRITNLKNSNLYDFTKIQSIICEFNSTLSDSVSASKVSIDNKVYEVLSAIPISTLIKDDENKTIEFGLTNETDKPLILRFFTYKEII